jgi:hypothetical protein
MILALIVMDRALPRSVRIFGGGVFFVDADKIDEFYRYYGIVKFPRTAFIFLTAVPMVVLGFMPNFRNVLSVMSIISVIIWGAFAIRDTMNAAISTREGK